MDLVEIADPEEKYEAMTRAAKEADRLGYDSIWLFDHFHTVPTPELETTFECFTALADLARDTQHVKLGHMASCNGYRNPALLAKIGSTLDVMSHGHFILGFGAGWYEHEYRAYGYGYPDTRERITRFLEATEIIHRMWTEDYPTFSGKYYTIDKPINEPKGVQRPHQPLWLAGSGEKVTLKLVAQWGDGCNIQTNDLQVLRHKLDVLREHCATFNRDFDELSRSVSINVVNGRHGMIWSIFPVRKSSVFFYIGKLGFSSVSSCASRSTHYPTTMPDHLVIFDTSEIAFGTLHAKGYLLLRPLAVLLTSWALTPGNARDLRTSPSH